MTGDKMLACGGDADRYLVYDGDCPVCRFYVDRLDLAALSAPIEALDARGDDPRVNQLQCEGYDLNEGIALVAEGRTYYADECLVQLAKQSRDGGIAKRTMARVFAHAGLTALLYPVLKRLRGLLLRCLGRKPIEPLPLGETKTMKQQQ